MESSRILKMVRVTNNLNITGWDRSSARIGILKYKGVTAGQTVDVQFTSTNAFNADAHFVTPVSQ